MEQPLLQHRSHIGADVELPEDSVQIVKQHQNGEEVCRLVLIARR
jgi:hypothetical protein